MTETCISLYDNADPEGEPSTQFYSLVVPRVGDEVCYWVDYPNPQSIDHWDNVPVKVTGRVARVAIDYRYMFGWGSTAKLHTQAGVWLDNYQATMKDAKE